MIYICYPCKWCSEHASCKICEQGCRSIGSACSECCGAIKDVCSKPMGGWVLMTAMGQALILAGAVWSVLQIMEKDKTGTENCSDASTLCYINIGCAVLHIFVSIWMQSRIVNKASQNVCLSKKKEETGSSDLTKKDVTKDDYEKYLDGYEYTKDDIRQATKTILLEDFVFCLYFFILPGSTFYNCYGISQLDSGECEVGYGPAFAAAMAMIAYGFMTMAYLPCAACGACCAGKHTAKKDKKSKTKPPTS